MIEQLLGNLRVTGKRISLCLGTWNGSHVSDTTWFVRGSGALLPGSGLTEHRECNLKQDHRHDIQRESRKNTPLKVSRGIAGWY